MRKKGPFYGSLPGLLAGLSHLARADGMLLLGVGGIVWLLEIKDWRLEKQNSLQSLISSLFLFILGYLLIMGGWFWRTYQLTGQPMSTIGTQTIFLTTYNDVFSYGRDFGLSDYLAWGWGNIFRSKLDAASLAIQTFIAVTGLTVFTFFFVWAWIKLGRKKETGGFLRPFTWYTIILYTVMILVFTFPGMRGSLLHSSAALWPWSMALAPAGIGFVVDWISDRRPGWDRRMAKRFFAIAMIFMVFLVSFVVSSGHPLLEDEAAVYRQLDNVLPEKCGGHDRFSSRFLLSHGYISHRRAQ